MVGREPEDLEKFKIILGFIEKNGGSVGYKDLQSHCEDLFEGVRLVLKKMKGQNLLDYEGMIPGFASIITSKKESA